MRRVGEAILDIMVQVALLIMAFVELFLALVNGLWNLPDYVEKKWRQLDE